MNLIIIFIVSIITGLLGTWVVRKWARHSQIGVFPDPRKMHQTFMPHMGGLGFVFGMLSGITAGLITEFTSVSAFAATYGGILLGSGVVVIVGIIDDVKGLTPSQKFLGQIIAVTILLFFNLIIRTIYNPLGADFEAGVLAIPLTYLWMIGVSNAINLLDGLDGLAAGVSLFVLIVFLIAGFQNGDPTTILIILALVGSLIGFLKFNFHPASIFMGDTGSLFLGFIIAALGIRAFENQNGSIHLIIPMIALAIPIGDTSVAFFRRLNKGHHPFKPDKDHLHHRLIQLGLSHKQAVMIIYFVSALYGLSAYLIMSQSAFLGVIIFILTVGISFAGLRRIGYLESLRTKLYYGDEDIIKVRQVTAPLFMKRVLHKIALASSDIIMVNLAFFMTWWVRFRSGWLETRMDVGLGTAMDIPVIFLVTIGWLGIFALNNLYNMRWDVSRFDQIRRIGKVVLFGIILIFIITLDPQNLFSEGRFAILIYGLSLFITVNIGRMAIISTEKWFSILEYRPHKTLLVGTTDKAHKLLKDIRKNPHLLYNFCGYLSKETREKQFLGLKYLGTYDEIASVIQNKGIEEVVLAINERSRDELLNIVALAEGTGVVFKIIPQFYDVVSGHKTEEVIGHPLIRLFPESMYLWQWALKRLFDAVFALILLIVLSPLFLLIVITQLLEGLVPPFIIQDMVGKFGKRFGMLNFKCNMERGVIGKFLYYTNIYKLPALVNILFGKMSFVGPRPENFENVNIFRDKIRFYNRRFQVRPGLTGWAQVKYRYEEALKHQREQLKHDLFYLENISLTFDFRIILRSLIIFFFRR